MAFALSPPDIDLLEAAEAIQALKSLLGSAQQSISAAQNLQERLGRSYRCIGSGATRTVFENDGTVYKCPNGWEHGSFDLISCIGANLHEAAAARDGYGPAGHPVARTRLYWHRSGLPVIAMEKVRIESSRRARENSMPGWTQCVDQHQLGRDTDDELVIFDAGEEPLDMPEAYYSGIWPFDLQPILEKKSYRA